MLEVLITAIQDFALYSLFVLLYTLVGAYQNINIWGMKFDWKTYVNGLVKWLALGGVVVGTTVGAFLLIAQAERQGIDIVDVQAIAPRVILGVVILASAVMVGKIITKLATALGVPKESLEQIKKSSLETPEDEALPVFFPDSTPDRVKQYVAQKLKDETEGGVGSFYSVPTGSYGEFKNAVINNGYDIDNYYGWQCWDGTALLWQQFGKSLITGNGLAIGCWDLKRDVNRYDLFDLVTDVNSLREGDVVCMRPNHIGFFDGYEGNYMRILGQNQGGRSNPAGGSAFNLARVAKSSFAGAFRLRKWNVAPAPAPTPAPAPAPATGDTSGFAVGDTVQVTNPVDVKGTHLNVSGNYSVMEISNGSIVIGRGGAVTARVLGSSLKKVGGTIEPVKPAPTPSPTGFNVGDTVVPTRRVSYDGVPLTQWDDTYTISEIKGDRAVLMARGAVWSAMNVADIRKA